jgi:VanZ family protein
MHYWLSRALTALLIAALAAMVIYVRLPAGPHYLYVLHKLGHPLAFGLIAWLIHTQRRGAPRWLTTLLLALLLGGATELAQAALGRDARWSDVARDGLGAAAALAMHGWWLVRRARHAASARHRPGMDRWCGLLAAMLLLAVAAPLLWCAAAYANRALRFPVLAQFSTPLDRYFVATSGARLETSDAPAGLRVVPDEHGSGLGLDEPTPDWSEHHTLFVEVSNPNDSSLSLMLRIHDRQHNWEHRDRYNRRFELPAHARQILRVPLSDVATAPHGRRMDLRQIQGIALFVPLNATPQPFVVSRLWLEGGGNTSRPAK